MSSYAANKEHLVADAPVTVPESHSLFSACCRRSCRCSGVPVILLCCWQKAYSCRRSCLSCEELSEAGDELLSTYLITLLGRTWSHVNTEAWPFSLVYQMYMSHSLFSNFFSAQFWWFSSVAYQHEGRFSMVLSEHAFIRYVNVRERTDKLPSCGACLSDLAAWKPVLAERFNV